MAEQQSPYPNSNERSLEELRASKPHNKDTAQFSELLAQVATGIRILEDRYSNLRKKTQLTDRALLEAQQNLSKEKRLLMEELMETKAKIQDMLEDIDSMKEELQGIVRQEDLKVIEKYLDFWDPMQFAYRKEVEDLLEDKKSL